MNETNRPRSASRLRPSPWDALVVTVVVLLAAAAAWIAYAPRADTGGALTVVITADGRELRRIPLASFPDEPVVLQNNGYTLSLHLLSDDPTGGRGPGVAVAESDCPGQDCVHTGAIRRPGQAIVCLPARVVVSLEGGSGSGPDVIVG